MAKLSNDEQSQHRRLIHALISELAAEGPYLNEDGDCTFCGAEPRDGDEALENNESHGIGCLWVRARDLTSVTTGVQ